MTESLYHLFIKPLLDGFGRSPSETTINPANTPSYDDLFKDERDGTARFDDVWGAPCHREGQGG